MFNYDKFKADFNGKIEALEKAEKITRDVLRELSREVLFALHEHGNIDYVNRLMQAKITPVNLKALTLFFQEFTGFFYSKEDKVFSKKNKRQYDAKKEACLEFLSDPHNNFWTWANREIEMERKAFDPKKVTRYIENSLKKAEADGFTQADVIRAILDGGLEIETLYTILGVEVVEQ